MSCIFVVNDEEIHEFDLGKKGRLLLAFNPHISQNINSVYAVLKYMLVSFNLRL